MRRLFRILFVVLLLVSSSQFVAAESSAVSPSAPNWSGIYLGGHFGGISERTTWAENKASFFANAPNAKDEVTAKGAMWGGQVGFNMQTAAWVYGLELSMSKSDADKTFKSRFYPTMDLWTTDLKWTGSATARLGYALDKFLPYVKGGFATARLHSKMLYVAPNIYTEDTKQFYGWTAGGGLEYMIARHWTAGIEFDYMHFQKKTYDTPLMFNSTAAGQESWKIGLSTVSCALRLNYKF
jgi:outer membrane immunogenic protein